MLWFALALGCAVIAAFAAVLTKESLMKESAVEFSAALALTNVMVSIPLLYWLKLSFPTFVWGVIFFSGLTAAGGFLLTAKALKHLDISIVSPLRNFSPALTALLAFFLLASI